MTQVKQNAKQSGNKEKHMFPSLAENINYLKNKLFHSDDLKKLELPFQNKKGTLLYIESLADPNLIHQFALEPLLTRTELSLNEAFSTLNMKSETNLLYGIQLLLQGKSLYFHEKAQSFCIFETALSLKRDIKEPDNEGIVRGPHTGFVEDLATNLTSIRKLIKNPNLVVKYFTLGEEMNTKVAIVYMQDLANDELVTEVKRRLQTIKTDSLMPPGYIQEFIEDTSFSPFPQQLNTERPDRTVANLMEGRVAILADGDPTALIVPVTLFAFYQSPDDYNNRWIVGSFIRLLRIVSFLIAFLLPAFYIATVAFHPDVLPLELVYTIKSSLELVPFPPIIEALLLELIFELLREAGIRLPSRVGQTIGIVGGLVIGDAIVKAGLVSYTMTIVVALTAISSFLVPSNDMSSAVRILRFPLMILAALFGYVGISFGLIITFVHLCQLHSFHTPYLSPIAPMRIKDMKDAFVRLPIWSFRNRPHDPKPKKMLRQPINREDDRDDQQSK
ncbi:spore germination protein GerKA [Bacillus sp. XF8]|uniref:spore germination protein GerKA n=1 Tax=Bacillus sp. XF8 TaxID=2819289 RepID=UPI001AA07847|nr:spore germination protein [Bacillus sp. XF8]MBO1579875.1 spore germination protein [Bacillus sp. XF8]